GDQAVVLMQVLPMVCEDEIRRQLMLQFLEVLLHLHAGVREEAVPELVDDDCLILHIRQKGVGAAPCLVSPIAVRAEHDPGKARPGILLAQSQDRASATDLNVVTVCSETQYIQWPRTRIVIEDDAQHYRPGGVVTAGSARGLEGGNP